MQNKYVKVTVKSLKGVFSVKFLKCLNLKINSQKYFFVTFHRMLKLPKFQALLKAKHLGNLKTNEIHHENNYVHSECNVNPSSFE